jgi:hypothetical protein
MRAWSPSHVCWWLFVALVAVPGSLGSIAGGFGLVARAQDATPPAKEPNRVQTVPIMPPSGWNAPEGSDRGSVERLFGESERLTRGLEPKRMQTIKIRPDALDAPAGRPR